MNDQISKKFLAAGLELQINVPLAKYTTWKVGGPAEFFLITRSSVELEKAIRLAYELEIPVTVLGLGSNILVSDQGIKGLVIRNTSTTIGIADEVFTDQADLPKLEPRLVQLDTKEYYSFSEINYDENPAPKVAVTIDSGVSLGYAVNFLISKGVTGLQWFAGIPGTIGGAIYNNIHGGTHYISEYVSSVSSLSKTGEIIHRSLTEIEFDYDYSIFQKTNEPILSVEMHLYKGDASRARETAIAWAIRKKQQPHNSAGCCFKNLTSEEQTQAKLDSNSWGYIIDKILGLKNHQIGGAKISPFHAAFIETQPGATAQDVLDLLNKVYTEANHKLGITPQTEIFFLGFNPEEVSHFQEH